MKVESIKIKLSDKRVIELTVEDARKLQSELNSVLGKQETVFIPYNQIINQPGRLPVYPEITWCSGDLCGTSKLTDLAFQ